MKSCAHAFLAALLVAFLGGAAAAQQQNSAAASMMINNEAGSGALIEATIDSPGVGVVEVSSEPGMPYVLLIGSLAPGWVSVPGSGVLDLNLTTVGKLVDGFALLKPLDHVAKTDADSGKAMLAASFGAGLVGQGPALQALVADPASPFGVTFTAASRLSFAPPAGVAAAVGAGSSGSSGPMNVSGSGMAGNTGALLAEVRAPIDAIGASDVTILQSVVVQIVGATKIRTQGGANLPFASLAVTDYVKVEMFADPTTGQFIAHEIRLESPSFGWQVKVEGAVDAVTASVVTMLGVGFEVIPSSDVDLDLATLAPGDYVEIKANADATTPGTYDVVEIHGINPLLAFNVEFRSRSFVDAVTASSITVLGVTVNVGPGVRFDDFSSLSQLTTSSYVEVRANPDTSGQLWASRIKVRSADNEVRVEGPVEMLMSPDFTIWGVTIQTNANTDWQQGLNAFGDLGVGLRVQAKGSWVGGAIVAEEVEIDT